MAKLIEKIEESIEAINASPYLDDNPLMIEGMNRIRYLVEDAFDEGEIQEVVRGMWITEFDDMGWLKHSCSNCGYFRRTDIHVELNWSYCPNCGAYMKGKAEHAE